jgi:hypothetical protein
MSASRPPAVAAGASVDAQLWTWRAERLVRVGFDRELAHRIAADARFDVHALIELCERTCPPELACRILAPLDPPT